MKKKILTVITALLSLLTGVRAQGVPAVTPISEIDLLVGQTQQLIPAGPLLTGMSVEEGENFLEVQRAGYMLIMKGVRAGDAKLRLDLRGGFIVTRFDLDYREWDIQIRPDLFE